MKDLLCKEESLYDFLEVPESSSRKEILNAVSRKMLVDVKKVTVARHNLLVPQQRLYYDLLFYDNKWLEGFSGGAFDSGLLAIDKRQALATSWEEHFTRHPSDGCCAHSLALLYYWWAKHEEDCCKEAISELSNKGIGLDAISDKEGLRKLWQEHNGEAGNLCLSPVPLEDIWSGLISWWLAFVNSTDFWETYFSEKEELCQEKLDRRSIVDIKEYLKERLHSQILDFLNHYQQNRVFHKAKEFLKYRFWYTAETNYISLEDKSAGGQGVKGGPLFLKKRGLLKEEEERLRSSFGKYAFRGDGINSATLRKLLYLSPYAPFLILVEEKNFDKALLEIGKLTADKKKEPAIRYLLSRIYLEKARTAKGQDNFEEAASMFAAALNFSEGINLKGKIKEEVVSFYINWAAGEKDNEKKVTILEKGYELVTDNERLNQELSTSLNILAVKIANDVINRINDEKNNYWRRVSANNRYLRALNAPRGSIEVDPLYSPGILAIEACFNCGKARYSSYGNWYTYNLHNGQVGMCAGCHYEIQSVNAGIPKPSRTDMSRLLDAYFKFKLAFDIDRVNQQAKENLDSLIASLKQYCSESGRDFSALIKEKEKKAEKFLEKRSAAAAPRPKMPAKKTSLKPQFVSWLTNRLSRIKQANSSFAILFGTMLVLPLLTGRPFLALVVATIGMWQGLGERRRMRLLWCALALWFIGPVFYWRVLYSLGFLAICGFLLYSAFAVKNHPVGKFFQNEIRPFFKDLPRKLKTNKKLWIGITLVILGLIFWPILIIAAIYLTGRNNKD